jgi:hypothetical protein
MRFSRIAFVVVFLLHAAGTLFLVLVAFGTAMSAFNHPATQVKQSMDALDVFSWFWSTGPRALQYFFGIPATLSMNFLWSLVLGIAAGFVFPRRRMDSQPTKRTPSDDSK